MINNLTGGIWNVTSDVYLPVVDSTANIFNNAGTSNKTGGTGTSTWNLAFGGAGAVTSRPAR